MLSRVEIRPCTGPDREPEPDVNADPGPLTCHCRWYELASRSSGKQRLDYLAHHTLAVWLWTLGKRHGTPCVPLIVRWQCTTHGHCGGIGDRIKGIQVGFWLVRCVLRAQAAHHCCMTSEELAESTGGIAT